MPEERDLRDRLNAALAQEQLLRDEIRQLTEALAQDPIPIPESLNSKPTARACLPVASEISEVSAPLDNNSKVTLFRSLFRGREDVYAERWHVKDGTWAYRPASEKDWAAVLASRPENR